MTEIELTTVIVDELKENALIEKYKDDERHAELIKLSKQVKKILEELPLEKATIINDYITKADIAADEDCRYLYVQGAKDCVKALKRLEVI